MLSRDLINVKCGNVRICKCADMRINPFRLYLLLTESLIVSLFSRTSAHQFIFTFPYFLFYAQSNNINECHIGRFYGRT